MCSVNSEVWPEELLATDVYQRAFLSLSLPCCSVLCLARRLGSIFSNLGKTFHPGTICREHREKPEMDGGRTIGSHPDAISPGRCDGLARKVSAVPLKGKLLDPQLDCDLFKQEFDMQVQKPLKYPCTLILTLETWDLVQVCLRRMRDRGHMVTLLRLC